MAESTFQDSCNCFALRQAARFVTQIYERHLGPIGLSAAQFTIMSKIAKSPCITMFELSRSMVMDRTTLVRALSPLQREGMIVCEQSPHEKRARAYSLSELGHAVFSTGTVAWQNAQEEFESAVGHDRAKFLRDELFDLTATRS